MKITQDLHWQCLQHYRNQLSFLGVVCHTPSLHTSTEQTAPADSNKRPLQVGVSSFNSRKRMKQKLKLSDNVSQQKVLQSMVSLENGAMWITVTG